MRGQLRFEQGKVSVGLEGGPSAAQGGKVDKNYGLIDY